MRLKIGLTGGIGSGKTTVAKIFETLAVPVYYADDASKRLYKTDKSLQQKLKAHFGDDIYEGDELDRTKMAALVFNNPQQLAVLNSLVHPPTIKDAKEWMERQTTSYVIKEAAVLFESGSNEGLDYVIGVYAPRALRLQRVIERDYLNPQEIEARMARQMDEEEKMKRCDFIITNDEQQLVIPQVIFLHQKFITLSNR